REPVPVPRVPEEGGEGAQARGLRRAETDRRGDRAPEARDHGHHDRRPDGGAGSLLAELERGNLGPAAAASRDPPPWTLPAARIRVTNMRFHTEPLRIKVGSASAREELVLVVTAALLAYVSLVTYSKIAHEVLGGLGQWHRTHLEGRAPAPLQYRVASFLI